MNIQDNWAPTAVREIQVNPLTAGLDDLAGYTRALLVFRWNTSVVGSAWLPVTNGRIHINQIRDALTAVAWPVWTQLHAPEPPQHKPLTATVAVCTRNRTDDLRHCLPGLAKLAARGHEVLIIDNNPSDDSTAQLVAQYPAITYVHEPRAGLDIARNRALTTAKGDIVAFTDDDAQVDDGWLDALLNNFADPTVAIVTGITMPLELETKAQLWFETTNSFVRGFERRVFDRNYHPPLAAGAVGAGVNMAIRRNTLPHIGLFDEALDGGTASRSGGDQEFFYRTLLRGFRIVYEPAALVWHRHRREWDALRSNVYAYGVGLFAWWTRAVLEEKELRLLAVAPKWFVQHHLRNLVRALLHRPGADPFDLAWAEFRGALQGSRGYLQARRLSHHHASSLSPLMPTAVSANR